MTQAWRYEPSRDGRSGTLFMTDAIGERPIVRIETAGAGHCIDTGRLIAEALGASASASDAEDAARWRALMASQRIRIMGSAGFANVDGAWVPCRDDIHIGVELWSLHAAAHPSAEFQQDKCRAQLIAYVDRVRAMAAASKPGGDRYVIWSVIGGVFWRENSQGYSRDFANAGRYTREQAIDICASCRNGYTHGDRPTEVPLRESAVLAAQGRVSSALVRPEDDADCRARDLTRKRGAHR